MCKRIYLTLLLVISTMAVYSQGWGVSLGLSTFNNSTLSIDENSFNNKSLPGVLLGVTKNFSLSNDLSFVAGANFCKSGYKTKFIVRESIGNDHVINTKTDFYSFDIPLKLSKGFKLDSKGAKHIVLNAGVYNRILFSGNQKITSQNDDYEINFDKFPFLKNTSRVSDNYECFEFGLISSVGVCIKNLQVDLEFTKMLNDIRKVGSLKHQTIGLTVTYWLKGKSKLKL